MTTSPTSTTPNADDVDYVNDVAQFRQDFRCHLRALEDLAKLRSAFFDNAEAQMAHDADVIRRLYDSGWNRYGWPEDVGGFGGGTVHRAVYYAELGRAMVAIPAQQWTREVMGPALIQYAPDLARQYLPGYLAGKEWWGQGWVDS